jgi:periplasmic protein TonB
MFEDSTFESAGRIHTASSNWMMATFALNSTILIALILIPLIYPQGLPRLSTTMLVEAPPPSAPEPRPQPQHITAAPSQMRDGSVLAPTVIPAHPLIVREPEPPSQQNFAGLGDSIGLSGSNFGGEGSPHVTIALQKPKAPTTISSGVMSGLLIEKTLPTYPVIAKAARVQGTVELQATISRTGTIENLHAVGGPAMLRQAALDAVKSWRYRPYLLDGVPVEVETTVSVIFTLQP